MHRFSSPPDPLLRLCSDTAQGNFLFFFFQKGLCACVRGAGDVEGEVKLHSSLARD